MSTDQVQAQWAHDAKNSGIDWYLYFIAYQAEVLKTTLPLVLQISGSVVIGRIISSEEYFNKHLELMNEISPAKEQVASNTRYLENFKKISDNLNKNLGILYIHLKDVEVCSPGVGGLKIEKSLWRGKLSEVDAWTIDF